MRAQEKKFLTPILYFSHDHSKEVGCVLTCVCLSVCPSAGLLKKSRSDFEEIFFRGMGRSQRNNRLAFSGDPGSLFTIAIPTDSQELEKDAQGKCCPVRSIGLRA